MAQNVTDRLQRDVRTQQAHGACVTDGMWTALAFRLETCPADAAAKDRVKTGSVGKGTGRGGGLNKELSQGCLRPSLAQVVEDGLTNFRHERQEQVGACPFDCLILICSWRQSMSSSRSRTTSPARSP